MEGIEYTTDGVALIRNNVENAQIIYTSGLSTADPENPSRPRERKAYLEKVLNPMIERGEIGDGIKSKFDDRKLRYDGASMIGTYDKKTETWVPIQDAIALRLGITHYFECAGCRGWDEKKRKNMTNKGKKVFDDSYAFFTRGCGVAVTPITSEGSIFAGRRKSGDGTFEGQLGAVNGWVEYEENLQNVDFRKDALRETEEEMGVEKSNLIDFRENAFKATEREFGVKRKDITGLIFCGISSGPEKADMDFVYLAPLNITNIEFLGRYEQRQDKEHEGLVKIPDYPAMQQLLESGTLPGMPHVEGRFDILYSLRFSLEQIRPNEMAR